jgi:hypothetical protein
MRGNIIAKIIRPSRTSMLRAILTYSIDTYDVSGQYTGHAINVALFSIARGDVRGKGEP